MRRKALIGVVVSAAVCVVVGSSPWAGVGVARAATNQATSRAALRITDVNLHGGYTRLLAKERPEPIAIAYAKGRHGTAVKGSPAVTCTEPACPLAYHGGVVQHTPEVYLLLWGPDWSPTGADAEYLHNFLLGLGVQPEDTWSPTMGQYADGTGHPTFSGSVLQGIYEDTTVPPTGVTQDELAAEADTFYSDNSLTDVNNTQIVVATQSGTCPQGFYSPSCDNDSGYCAWHSYSSVNAVSFTNLPYLPDAGVGCGQDAVNADGPYDGFSIVEGHEYAESTTDPFPDSGWIDLSDIGSGGEIADKCAWVGLADVTLSTGSFAMQPLWSNSVNECVLSDLAIATRSLRSGVVGEAYSATVTATGGTTPYTWSRFSGTKPPGLSFAASGVWSGTPTTAGTYSFMIRLTDHAGTQRTEALSITVTALTISTTSLRSGTVGKAYSATVTATGGTAPYTWSRISGTKPPGLSFSPAGAWSGTPTTSGTYSFTIQVTDHLGIKTTKPLKIVIAK